MYQKFWMDKVQKHNRKFARKYGKMDGLVVYYDLLMSERKVPVMNLYNLNLNEKIEDLLAALKKKEDEKEKNTVLWVLAIIGAVAAVAGIAFAVYRFFAPDYLEDFEEDFDDDFDDYFEDEEE